MCIVSSFQLNSKLVSFDNSLPAEFWLFSERTNRKVCVFFFSVSFWRVNHPIIGFTCCTCKWTKHLIWKCLIHLKISRSIKNFFAPSQNKRRIKCHDRFIRKLSHKLFYANWHFLHFKVLELPQFMYFIWIYITTLFWTSNGGGNDVELYHLLGKCVNREETLKHGKRNQPWS